MKTLRTTLFSLICFLSVFTVNAQDFSFDMEMTGVKMKEPMIMKLYSSGTKMVIKPQIAGAGGMSVLVDEATKKQYLMMDNAGQKMAMVMNYTDQMNKAAETASDTKITVTTETKTIDGYKCKKIIAESAESKSDIWLTEDLGMNYADLYKMMSASGNGPQGKKNQLPAMKDVKGFPIEMNVTDKAKQETINIRIKNISKAKISPSMFSLEGYQMMDMGTPKK
jgi:hypothetical protein